MAFIKNFLIIALGIFSLSTCASGSANKSTVENATSKEKELKKAKEYQQELKEEMENPETSILLPEERKTFKGLQFYPASEDYIVAAKCIEEPELTFVEVNTSTGRIQKYKVLGYLDFQLDNKPFKLTVYQPYPRLKDHPDYLFLPFYDLTNGETTYGGGRYLEFNIPNLLTNPIFVDFNKSYNPYCAYSPRFSCPIPPIDNKLDIEIKAGIKYEIEY